MTTREGDRRHETVIEYTWRELAVPADAVNLALATGGVVASASTATDDPTGAINGNHTLAGWGKGNGWQAAPVQKYPNWWGDWLELTFPGARTIDAVVVYTFPEHVLGRNKMGLRDYQLQVREGDTWETLDTVRDNVAGTIVHRFGERPVRALRLLVTRANTGGEEGAMSHAPDLARVLEVEAYRLGSHDLWREERRQVHRPAGNGPRIAILRDDLPAVAHSAPALPESLADLIHGAGYTVTFLDARDLTAESVLSPDNFDLLVHPYGPAFPLGSALYDYLASGGHLLALGGYAFTEALQWEGGRWIATGWDPGLTDSAVRHHDHFTALSEQLGLFGAPGHTLRDVAYIATAPGQTIVRRAINRPGGVTGPSAVAVVGDMPSLDEEEQAVRDGRREAYVHKVRTGINHGHPLRGSFTANYPPLFARPSSRWVPLVTAYDRYERVRGTVGAVLLHHAGLYRGSRWAYFGADNVDLFAPAEEDLRAALLEIVDFLLQGLTLHSVQSDLDCYHPGEAVTVSAIVDNAARQAQTMELRLAVTPAEGEEPVFERRETLALEPAAWRKMAATWRPERFERDLYRVEASLWLDGALYDREESGFVAWDERVIARGPHVEFANNYFTVDGVRRFLLGARNDGIHIHGQVKEDTLWCDREYRMMRDYGQDMVSPVFFSAYIEGLGWGQPGEELIPETLLRAVDAQVQLAQKHGLIYGLCVFFVGEDEAMFRPERSRALCAALGERYKDVPGILFYIWDDGWREDPAMFNAWAHSCVEGFAQSGRKYLVTAEWSSPGGASDVHRDATRELDFASYSCYHGLAENPVVARMLEMRALGKGFTNAEFGRQATSGTPTDHHVYLQQPHHHFGMGHALALNWKWKDNDHAIFPWGIVFPGDWVPKDELNTYRNSALLFRQFHPIGAMPPVVLLLPRAHWAGDYMRVYPYLLDLLEMLMDLGVDFTVIDEADLARLPGQTRALLYPLPQCAPSHVFPLLREFVACGGFLWMSGGDESFVEESESGVALRALVGAKPAGWLGPQREHLPSLSMSRALPRRTITPTEEVPGLRAYEGQPCVRLQPTEAQVAAVDHAGQPVILLNTVGAGRTLYSSDLTLAGARATFPAFLDLAGVPWRAPDRHGAHIFTLPVEEGTVHTVTVDPWNRTRRTVEVAAGAWTVRLGLSVQEVGLVAVNRDGAVCAVEGLSLQMPDGQIVLDASGHVMLSAIGAADLQDATGLILLPIEPGTMRLHTDQTLDAVAGDVVDGRWVTREILPVQRDNGWISLTPDSTLARSLILLATPDHYGEHVRWLESLMAGG